MSISPLRRIAAVAAIAGVTALGGVALAPAALADDGTTAPAAVAPAPAAKPAKAPELKLVLPNVKDSGITWPAVLSAAQNPAGLPLQSPLPDGIVTWDLGGGMKLRLLPQVAQQVQTVAANLYSQAGYLVAFNEDGLLAFGKKICDPTQPKDSVRNKGCSDPHGPRF
jgi:hypothetical protein